MSKKVDSVLSPNFVEEMLRLAFSNKRYARLVVENLDVSNFPREMGSCKAMLKVLSETMNSRGELATFGMVEMRFPNNQDISNKISEIKALAIPDEQLMVEQLETFIKRQTFVAVQNEIADMYNEGRIDEAMLYAERKTAEINLISFQEVNGKFTRIYRDFYKGINRAQQKADDETRSQTIPFGITTLDDMTGGGAPRQDTILWIMRSGVGKSTALRYMAWFNTSIAHNHVLHFQLEGGEDEVVVKFDQMISRTTYSKVLHGDFSENTNERVKRVIKRAEIVNSDIDVYATDEMVEMTISKMVEVMEDYFKEYGYYPDLVTVDSIDLILTGDSKKIDYDPTFLKYRLQRCAQRFKDFATKYNCVLATATQTGDVDFEVWNDPTKVITRHNTEGDRTLVKPFSFVFTGNMTLEETKERVARIFCDKLRNFQNNGIVIRIPTDYENGFFYDMTRAAKVESILDMSALESAESQGKRCGHKKGEKLVRRETAPGVFTLVPEGEAEVAKNGEKPSEPKRLAIPKKKS